MEYLNRVPRVRVALATRPSKAPLYVLIFTALLMLAGSASAQGYAKAGELRHERKRWAHDELPAELPSRVLDAASAWGPWAEEQGYALLLDESMQAIIIVERRDRTAMKQLKVAEETLEIISELSLISESSPTTPSTKHLTLDDAESESSWGSAGETDKDRLPVIALVHDQEALKSILKHWMKLRPELEWDSKVRENHISFISPDPLFAALVTRDTSRNEWDLNHETAALLTRLMLKRSYGKLPAWIEAGLTWQVETRLFNSIWHFFGRKARFISSASHSGWEKELRSMARAHELDGDIFYSASSFTTEEWSMRNAQLAWGLMGVISESLGDRLSDCLSALRELREAGSRVLRKDGSWNYDTSYLPPIQQQFSVIADLMGEDFEEQALKSMKRGLKRSGESR
ncbi:MAG: hypothetical protein OSB14_12060 [Planctomycetota bacterium]|nr:hypothetical protein [Planctomycetota bacterium]